MRLQPIEKIGSISDKDFKKNYYQPSRPVVLTELAKKWPAYEKWNWDYFKNIVGDKKVGIYNNIKSDAYTPVNKADDYITFGEYIDSEIGVKSFFGSNGTSLNSQGLIRSESFQVSSVYPSGSALATAPAPMLPPPPGRLSTIIRCGQRSLRPCAKMRANASKLPPGAAGTTMRTGRVG